MIERPAVVFNNGESFVEIAMVGTALYEANATRNKEFIIPIMVPDALGPEDVLSALNGGRKRVLKTGVMIDVAGINVDHKKLSKR